MSNHLLENVTIYWPILDKPKQSKHKDKPATWSLQMRTSDTAEAKRWKSIGLKLKSHIGDDEDPDTYQYVNVYKKSVVKNEERPAPTVVDARGKALNPAIVGNGSIANVSLYEYQHPSETSPTGFGTAFTLMGVQVVQLVKYTPKPRNEFKDLGYDTEQIGTSGEETESTDLDDEDQQEEHTPAPPARAAKPATGTVPPKKTTPPPPPSAEDDF